MNCLLGCERRGELGVGPNYTQEEGLDRTVFRLQYILRMTAQRNGAEFDSVHVEVVSECFLGEEAVYL